MESRVNINLPKRPVTGKPIPKEWGDSVRDAISKLASRKNPTKQQGGFDTLPPFTVALQIVDGDPLTFNAYVAPGKVCERDLAKGTGVDAMSYFDLDDQVIDVDGFPIAFPIAENEAVFVKVLENSSGYISGTPAVEIVVAADNIASTNYIPSTQSGEYYYKLAALKTVDGFLQLVNFMAGSHIYHTSGLTCDVRILTCDPGEGYDPAQLLRISFLSGRVVSVGATVADRPLAPTVEECNIVHCT